MHIYKTLPTEHAVHAAICLIKGSAIGNEKPIIHLIECCNDTLAATRAFIQFILKQPSSERAFVDPHFYELALARTLAWKIGMTDMQLAADLIKQLADYGFRGDVIAMAQKYFNRAPSDDEILALVTKYCNNKAVRGESDEQALLALAKECGSKKTFALAQEMIAAFIVEWDNSPSI